MTYGLMKFQLLDLKSRYFIFESYNNHKKIEQTPYLFNFLIKIYFGLIDYQEEYSRIIPASCSALTMITLCFLSKHLGNERSYIFTLF